MPKGYTTARCDARRPSHTESTGLVMYPGHDHHREQPYAPCTSRLPHTSHSGRVSPATHWSQNTRHTTRCRPRWAANSKTHPRAERPTTRTEMGSRRAVACRNSTRHRPARHTADSGPSNDPTPAHLPHLPGRTQRRARPPNKPAGSHRTHIRCPWRNDDEDGTQRLGAPLPGRLGTHKTHGGRTCTRTPCPLIGNRERSTRGPTCRAPPTTRRGLATNTARTRSQSHATHPAERTRATCRTPGGHAHGTTRPASRPHQHPTGERGRTRPPVFLSPGTGTGRSRQTRIQ